MKLTILKRDSRGRVTYSRDNRDHLLSLYDRSGDSGQSFAKKYGIKYTTLESWLQKRRKKSVEKIDEGEKKPTTFVVSEINISPKDEEIVLEVGQGFKLRILNKDMIPLVVDLLKAMQAGKVC